jgi:hypothetical protein
LRSAKVARAAISGNRRFLLAAIFDEGSAMSAGYSVGAGELVLFDLKTGAERTMSGFGKELGDIAINHSGTIIAATRLGKGITIGSTTRNHRYVIPGADAIRRLAISPDDKWVAASAGPEIRLYPMPDLSRPPLHTLPHDELMSRLDGMTNLRAVPDPASPTGYKLEAGPFPGWQKVPRWQ